MPILVTGLSGFVGSHFGSRVPGAVDLLDGARAADIRRRDEVVRAVAQARPDAVLHLAAQAAVPASFDDPAETYDTNFEGTLNLLMALRESGFRGRMLFVGSADIYGTVPEAELPITEGRPSRPLNPYAVSKVAAEALCYQWSQAGPFEIVMARPFNHIGPRQSPQFAVSDFARQIAAGRRGRGPGKLVVGDIDTTRDFTDVRDIVRAYELLLKHGRNGEAYNVCSGVERSVRDVIAAMLAAAGADMPLEVDAHRLRKIEQRRMLGSFAKLQADTGWRPEIPFGQTLADTLNYWDEKEQA
ncbi:GDP-mannose 4,6-dehydratase [Caenimonas aquaedulcis]|uniref:GDP-mannose 4,6-dehydratase n=1 Tax=Caenimonas aquaedulcis TaxID=2793270 RepID=A0A931MH95_9BURK|nr:GDP-mannose 4,6-dehydratase [Caenimonas aquaedulcis]MBG9388876.1 GDP-mannose 4,6-dehydratase [Caenimonas aquaedulcis]